MRQAKYNSGLRTGTATPMYALVNINTDLVATSLMHTYTTNSLACIVLNITLE